MALIAMVITILCGAATLFGNLRGVIFYPSQVDTKIRDVHLEAAAADTKAVNVAATVTAQEIRLKALEDYRSELRSAIELLVYRANEMKISLDKMNDKLDQRRDRRSATDNP